MARKSKTQKAKASAARQARKAEREQIEETSSDASVQSQDLAVNATDSSKSDSAKTSQSALTQKAKETKSSAIKESKGDSSKSKSEDNTKPKKQRFQFLRDVQSEMKRVTWPTKVDVLRWTGVVVTALVFFGLFTSILDNLIVTPLLVFISGGDPTSIDWFNALNIGGGDLSSASSDATSLDTSSAAAGDASQPIDADVQAEASAPQEGE